MLPSLIPSPLHPAVVHLPIAFTVLAPVLAAGALVAIRRGARPLRAWGAVTAMLAALSLSAWAAVATGEATEERVESVVPAAPLEAHEEAAEAFLSLAVVVLAVAAVGLRPGPLGRAARVLGAAGTVALLGAGWNVGHSGGGLVYQHGAARAYADPPERAPATRDERDASRHEREPGRDAGAVAAWRRGAETGSRSGDSRTSPSDHGGA